jgi:TonB-linked SusC/RagA family outer membrane protein
MKFYDFKSYGTSCIKDKILRGMKLTILFSLTIILQVNASTFAQNKITLSESNTSFVKVLKAIGKQSGFDLVYISKSIKTCKPVSIFVKEVSLQEALDQVFLNQPLTYFIKNSIITVKAMKVKSNLELIAADITGIVLDESGKGIPGATIKVKRTGQIVITNREGKFSFRGLNNDDVLIVSYVGYQTQEIKANSNMRIKLVPYATELAGDVVIVGYGRQKKATVTSSVSQVIREEINSTPGASLQNMLTGKVTGLTTLQRTGQPGADAAQIYVRGVSTLSGFSTTPLILVDNVEYEYEQFARIDQNEIENVSILKDAASTAIYGIKGANGVILVTTRRGKLGKPVINLRTELGANLAISPFEALRSYDAAVLRNEALKNDLLAPQFTQEDLDLFKSGTDPYGHPDVNWYDVVFGKVALQNDNNIDISGGTERVKYFTSVGYLLQDGLFNDLKYKGEMPVPDASPVNNNYYFKRYKFRSNLDIDATKSLRFSLDLNGTFAETNSPAIGNLGFQMTQYEYVQPYAYPLYNPDGSFGFPNPAVFTPRDNMNSVGAIVGLSGYNRSFNNFLSANFSANQKLDAITKGLSVKALFAYSNNNTASRSMTRGEVPSFYYNPATGTYTPKSSTVYRIPPLSLGYSAGTPAKIITYQGILNYERSFGKHEVAAIALYNRSSRVNGATPPNNFLGYTFRGTYNYDQRYLFEVSGAYNGSSNFISQKRYTLFPAVSLGWNMAKEAFVERALPFMDMFKLRGSFGYTGSDDIAGYQYTYESFYSQGFGYNLGETANSFTGVYEGKLGNDNVSWATERKANVGLDFSFFKGKLSGSLDYFDNDRYDILINRKTIPSSYGVPSATLPPVNLGEVSNKGFEIELSHKSHIGKLGYRIKTNISYAKNKIVFMDEAAPDPSKPWLRGTGMQVGLARKYIWTGEFYTQAEVNDPNTPKPSGSIKPGWLKYKDLDGNKIINVDDMAYTGNPNVPNTVIGVTLGFDYKGFSISALMQSNLNGESYTGFDMAVPFKTQLQKFHQNRWTPETANTATFPALTTTFAGTYMNPEGNLSTFWATSTNFLRMRSAEIAYQVPAHFADKLGLAAVRIYSNAYNVFTISDFYKKYQYDPEVASNVYGYVYPTTRLINMGISVTLK